MCDVLIMEDEEGFQRLVEHLSAEHGGRVVAQYDGPDAIRWLLQFSEGQVELHHDDAWGNRIVSTGPNTDALVAAIGAKLEAALVR